MGIEVEVFASGRWQSVMFRTVEDAQEFVEVLEDNGYSANPVGFERKERSAGVL